MNVTERLGVRRRLAEGTRMNDWAGGFPQVFVSLEGELAREFEDRLRESGTLAFRVAFSVLRHRQDAEDVAQESMVKAYRSFSRLRDRERFRAWLVRTSWRMALDRKRGDLRRLNREQGHPDEVSISPETMTVERERASHLWTAIDALPDKLRLAIVLSSIEGHDTREVAALLRIPEGTVRSRLFLARAALGEKLRWLMTNR
jgi:RNA polymerase sigma-70 factor, ECF subfamily